MLERDLLVVQKISYVEIMVVFVVATDATACSGSWSGNFKDTIVVDAHIFQQFLFWSFAWQAKYHNYSRLQHSQQELPSQVPELQPTAVAQVCSPSDKQETSLSGTASTATPVDPVCSPRDTEFPSFKPYPLCGKSSPPSLLFCSTIRAYNCIPVSTACFQQQHPTQPLASLALQSNLKTIF